MPPVPEPDFEPSTRRRFADRIKRVAPEGDSAASPMVPLKSTWKSKTEADAVPEPEPQPAQRPTEATRRPRASAQPAAEEAEDLSRILANVVSATEAPTEAPTEATPEPAEDEGPELPERRPRAVTPRPEPAAEAPRTARPQLFGGRRPGPVSGAPLPDLSSLRATPEEIAASAEAHEEEIRNQAAQAFPTQTTEAEDTESEDTAPPSRPERSVERTRVFDRASHDRPAAPAPPREEPSLRAAPVARSPMPPRMAGVAAAEPVAPKPALDDAQFSPRAIMMRERRAEPDTPAPRRERMRIAARAVPASATPDSPTGIPAGDQALVEEALALILSRAADLEREVDPDSKVPVDLILDHSRETGELLQAVVARGQSDALRQINSDLGEVMDLIMLMQLEKGHAPADDALTLLLQLRRELETLRAA